MHRKAMGLDGPWLVISSLTFVDFKEEYIRQTGDEQLIMDFFAARA
jgi:hypothetical protein